MVWDQNVTRFGHLKERRVRKNNQESQQPHPRGYLLEGLALPAVLAGVSPATIRWPGRSWLSRTVLRNKSSSVEVGWSTLNSSALCRARTSFTSLIASLLSCEVTNCVSPWDFK